MWFSIVPALPTFFFLLVVIVNLNNWCFYYFKICDMARSVEMKIMTESEKLTLKKWKLVINVFTVVCICITVTWAFAIIFESAFFQKNLSKTLIVVSGVNHLLSGSLFIVSGFMINLKIKKSFTSFYIENRTLLWLATLGLSVPILSRGILDLARVFNVDFEKFVHRFIKFYNPAFFLLGDLLPLLFQLSSLVFGYIRRRKNKQI